MTVIDTTWSRSMIKGEIHNAFDKPDAKDTEVVTRPMASA